MGMLMHFGQLHPITLNYHFCREISGNRFCSLVTVVFHCWGYLTIRFNEMRISQMRLEQETPEFRARTSRLTKWRELCLQAQKDLELPPKIPERIQTLGFSLEVFCVAFDGGMMMFGDV